ncbi:MAG: amino acid ABC transporter substrate-binding protein [Bacteroidia bacterium]|nr:amino acid ABC transporter substrate-binding protein [Bacteroidia bacterium]
MMRYIFLVSLGIIIWGNTSFAQSKKSNNVSLLLPFNAKQIISNPSYKDAELGNMCREYYQGALIALDSCEKANIAVRLTVFDTENDSLTVLNILQKQAFKESELIIGPVKQNGNIVLSDFCEQNKIFHVSPLMTFSKSKIDDPYWVSANPDLPVYAKFITKHITSTDSNAQIIVITDKSVLGRTLFNTFKQLGIEKKGKIKTVEFTPDLDLSHYTKNDMNNHIIVAALQDRIVNATLRKINDTITTPNLHTYGFMQWFDSKTIEYRILERCNLKIISPFYSDYSRDDVKQFITKYREKFYTEPTEAAYKGYDQMLMLVHAMNKQGKQLMNELTENTQQMLGTKYFFVKQKNGSYQNQFLNILKFENYKLIPIN